MYLVIDKSKIIMHFRELPHPEDNVSPHNQQVERKRAWQNKMINVKIDTTHNTKLTVIVLFEICSIDCYVSIQVSIKANAYWKVSNKPFNNITSYEKHLQN